MNRDLTRLDQATMTIVSPDLYLFMAIDFSRPTRLGNLRENVFRPSNANLNTEAMDQNINHGRLIQSTTIGPVCFGAVSAGHCSSPVDMTPSDSFSFLGLKPDCLLIAHH